MTIPTAVPGATPGSRRVRAHVTAAPATLPYSWTAAVPRSSGCPDWSVRREPRRAAVVRDAADEQCPGPRQRSAAHLPPGRRRTHVVRLWPRLGHPRRQGPRRARLRPVLAHVGGRHRRNTSLDRGGGVMTWAK